jgi:nitrite reductase/ring-hydroxylating ferredoxin subunit
MSQPFDTAAWQALPQASALQSGGSGLRFEVQHGAQRLPAFVIKSGNTVHAYLNQCAHVAMELDWQPGQFFDGKQRYLMCATHGALYVPSTGRCVDGPCAGKQLKSVPLQLNHGVYYAPRRI